MTGGLSYRLTSVTVLFLSNHFRSVFSLKNSPRRRTNGKARTIGSEEKYPAAAEKTLHTFVEAIRWKIQKSFKFSDAYRNNEKLEKEDAAPLQALLDKSKSMTSAEKLKKWSRSLNLKRNNEPASPSSTIPTGSQKLNSLTDSEARSQGSSSTIATGSSSTLSPTIATDSPTISEPCPDLKQRRKTKKDIASRVQENTLKIHAKWRKKIYGLQSEALSRDIGEVVKIMKELEKNQVAILSEKYDRPEKNGTPILDATPILDRALKIERYKSEPKIQRMRSELEKHTLLLAPPEDLRRKEDSLWLNFINSLKDMERTHDLQGLIISQQNPKEGFVRDRKKFVALQKAAIDFLEMVIDMESKRIAESETKGRAQIKTRCEPTTASEEAMHDQASGLQAPSQTPNRLRRLASCFRNLLWAARIQSLFSAKQNAYSILSSNSSNFNDPHSKKTDSDTSNSNEPNSNEPNSNGPNSEVPSTFLDTHKIPERSFLSRILGRKNCSSSSGSSICSAQLELI